MYLQNPPCILTIAGSDSGGGAGVQADIKTISALGGYGLSVLTALTAQNTLGVQGIHPVPPDFVRAQMDSVLSDIPVQGAKTGMLFSKEIIAAVADTLQDKSFPLVVDPVCVSQSGDRLLEGDALKALQEKIIPLADLITPNRPEAELLTGKKIGDTDEIGLAAESFFSMGAKAVLIKGGHFKSERMRDWLFLSGSDPVCVEKEKVSTSNTHGTGCTLSAALATCLGQGMDMPDALRRSRDFLHLSIKAAFPFGSGQGPVNHLAGQIKNSARQKVLQEMEDLRDQLIQGKKLGKLVPEVGMNIALGLPWSEGFPDVAAFDGRIRRTKSGRLVVGCPLFGASSHMAKVLLAGKSINPDVNCVANIRYNRDSLRAIKDMGLPLAWFDRAEEPEDVKEREGSSLEWGTLRALQEHSSPETVKVIADGGEAGKEPMLRLLGRDCSEILDLLLRLAETV